MIIIEGPDGGGKTTLIRQLQERYGLSVAPRVVSKDTEPMVDLVAWVEENLNNGFQHAIFDRHRLISEPIYGPILRQKQQPGFDNLIQLAYWTKRFYAIEPLIIYCLPPLEVVRANVTGDPDNTKVADKIDQIYAAYCHRISIEWAARAPVQVWDYTRDWVAEEDPLLSYDSYFKHKLGITPNITPKEQS